MLENLKIKTRFGILIVVSFLLLLSLVLVQDYNLKIIKSKMDSVYLGGTEDVATLYKINDQVKSILVEVGKARDGKLSSDQVQNALKEAKAKINQDFFNYLKEMKENTNLANKNNDLINKTDSKTKEFLLSIEKFQDFFRNNDRDNIVKNYDELSLSADQLSKNYGELVELHKMESRIDYNDALDTISSIRFSRIIFIMFITIFLIILSLWIALSIINQIKKANEIIKKLTVGDLNFHIENYSSNEMGQMLKAMQTLAISDKKIAEALTAVAEGNLDIFMEPRSDNDTLGIALVNMIKNLRHIIGEIQNEISNLTTSSQEIVTSVAQVATSSSETAAAVTETTTSLEELKQTAIVTDEKSKDVLGNSEETLQIVGTSEKLLQATIEDMQRIDEKMHTISEGIVKLSDHSKTIGEIIDTVNDLAEQSNLLAVNAAIEAAKAGEHGKGFVVVAQEIRTLAEQSKAATIQVRSILNEIQNSTTAAVLATEQGAKAVEKGVQQSAQTNESMRTLSVSVANVTQAANQIAISSQQQFVGIEQSTDAMNNISEATSQLVDHMKQIESAVTSLYSIGENLKEMIDLYKMKKNKQQMNARTK